MAQKANRVKQLTNRRRILQGLGALGAASIAGCFGGGDGGGDGGGIDPVQNRVTVDPEDIVEGGTFRTAIAEPVDSFDVPYSSSAAASNVHGLLYEGMITTNASGAIKSWLASSYEQVDVQETEAADYEDYMITAEYEDEIPQVEEQIVLRHPDNDPTSDEGQFLTVNEAPDAVEDGTYGMHYRFDLHEGVEFHDGEEMTADNVVASYERLQGSLNSGQLYDSLLDIQADGDYTVHLYAQLPDAQAIRNLGGWEIYPTAVTELPPEANDPRQGNTPLGTGPFTFEEYEDAQYVTLSKNENYWFETSKKDWYEGPDNFPNGPVVDAVDISIIPDPATRSAALQNDELDMAYGLTASTLNDYQSSEDYRTAATKGAGFNFLQFPVNVEPFTDARVRRAINHLIPRESIANNIFSGWENPAWVPMPPIASRFGTTDYDQLVDDLQSYNTYDREESDSLVEEAIEENDWETPIDVTIETNSNSDDRVRLVELVVESLNQSDYFSANMETYPDIPTWAQEFYSADYAQKGVLSFIGLSSGFGPHGYAKAIHHPDNYRQCCNFMNINDEELNEALQDARYGLEAVQDRQTRQERYDEIWEMILELNANSYGTHSTTVGVVRQGEVFGYNTYPSSQSVVPYATYSPSDEQIIYIDR
ncbi:hypothetical protein GCM10028857_02890 [Salinarchaeum chitinilyticum]